MCAAANTCCNVSVWWWETASLVGASNLSLGEQNKSPSVSVPVKRFKIWHNHSPSLNIVGNDASLHRQYPRITSSSPLSPSAGLTQIAHIQMWVCSEEKRQEIRKKHQGVAQHRWMKKSRWCFLKYFATFFWLFPRHRVKLSRKAKKYNVCAMTARAESPVPYTCPTAAAIQAPADHQIQGWCSDLITALTRQRTSLYSAWLSPPSHHILSVCPPETVHVLCSNCWATFRPVEYMCCVFLSFALCASLRPLYSLLPNKLCACFPVFSGTKLAVGWLSPDVFSCTVNMQVLCSTSTVYFPGLRLWVILRHLRRSHNKVNLSFWRFEEDSLL